MVHVGLQITITPHIAF